MPDLASRSDAVTSAALLPMEDTMPRPVTTTRLMMQTFSFVVLSGAVCAGACHAWLHQAALSLNRPTRRSVAL